MLKQRTLQSLTKAVGVGLHSGQRVELTLRPAQPDTGIVFRRVDLAQPVDIPITATAVTDTRLASTISNGDAKVHTVEHLMSACSGLGLDNLYIDITAEEVPILDGSASSFVFLLQSAGIALQNAPKRFIRVLQPVEVREGEGANVKWAKLEPHHGYKLSFEIDFRHPAVDSTGQCVVFDMDTYKVLNSDGLRYDDEFVKHKILDAMGDLYLLGKPLLASYSAFRSGHAMNNKLLRELLNHPQAYEVVTFEDERLAPPGLAQLAPAW